MIIVWKKVLSFDRFIHENKELMNTLVENIVLEFCSLLKCPGRLGEFSTLCQKAVFFYILYVIRIIFYAFCLL